MSGGFVVCGPRRHVNPCATAHEAQAATLDNGVAPLFHSQEDTMNLADVKAYIEAHLTEAADEIRVQFAQVVAFVEGKQAQDAAVAQAEVDRVAAEVADLTGKGYTVTAPVVSEWATKDPATVYNDIVAMREAAGYLPLQSAPVEAAPAAEVVPEPVVDVPAV